MSLSLLVLGSVSVAAGVWAWRDGQAVTERRLLAHVVPVVGVQSPVEDYEGPDGRWLRPLRRAGLRWSRKQSGLAIAGVLVAGVVLGFKIGVVWLGVPVACGVSLAWLRWRIAARKALMSAQLPEALMLMTTALRSGLGFQQALDVVAKEGVAPLCEELQAFGQDLSLGLPMEAALARLQARLGSAEAEMLASALLIQRQTGGNLVDLLRNLHDTMRDRQTLAGQLRALTAQGRLSGIVLSAIPVCIAGAFYVLNRAYLQPLWHDPRGVALSVGAIALFVLGLFWIRRIVSIPMA